MRITLPPVYAVDEWRAKNRVRQLGASSSTLEGVVATFSRGRVGGHLFQPNGSDPVLVIPHPKTPPAGHEQILEGTLDPAAAEQDRSRARWLKHPARKTVDALSDAEENIRSVLESWEGAFSFTLEDVQRGRIGLRPPQVGAVHAVHAHWTVSDDVATIVMPTGTGKTDTMLSILVSGRCAKVLVIVPTDALRAQLAEKFLTLGVLKASLKQAIDYLGSDGVRTEDAALHGALLLAHRYLDAVLPETRAAVVQAVGEALGRRGQPERGLTLFENLLPRAFGLNAVGERDAVQTFRAWRAEFERRLVLRGRTS